MENVWKRVVNLNKIFYSQNCDCCFWFLKSLKTGVLILNAWHYFWQGLEKKAWFGLLQLAYYRLDNIFLFLSANTGPAPTSTRWTVLCLDMNYILSVYLNRSYAYIKGMRLCANMLVKNVFTSDVLYDPGDLSVAWSSISIRRNCWGGGRVILQDLPGVAIYCSGTIKQSGWWR